MNFGNIYKNVANKGPLFLFMVLLILFVLVSNPLVGNVRPSEPELYTIDQIQRMMRYHGALVAKFDGMNWRFWSGSAWIKLDNANALKYAKVNSKQYNNKS